MGLVWFFGYNGFETKGGRLQSSQQYLVRVESAVWIRSSRSPIVNKGTTGNGAAPSEEAEAEEGGGGSVDGCCRATAAAADADNDDAGTDDDDAAAATAADEDDVGEVRAGVERATAGRSKHVPQSSQDDRKAMLTKVQAGHSTLILSDKSPPPSLSPSLATTLSSCAAAAAVSPPPLTALAPLPPSTALTVVGVGLGIVAAAGVAAVITPLDDGNAVGVVAAAVVVVAAAVVASVVVAVVAAVVAVVAAVVVVAMRRCNRSARN